MHSSNDDKAAPSPPYSESAAPFTEQDNRPLPEGWIRQWDPNYQQYFFVSTPERSSLNRNSSFPFPVQVDTRANPPHSLWDHPLDDPQYRKAHGLPADSDSESITSSSSSSSDSDSEGGDKKKKTKSGKKLKRQENPNAAYAGPIPAPHPASSGAPRGLFGMLTQGLFGPRPSPQVSPGVAGPSVAGPSFAPMQAGMMYAPPSYPYNKRDMRWARREEKRSYRAEKREEKRTWRAERRANKHERRMMKAQRKAMRRGYVPGVPQMPQMLPQSPPFPGMSREYQPGSGYGMPSEKRAY